MATVALFTFINEWNSFIAPLIYLNDQAMWPLGIGLYGFYTRMSAEWGFLMAASVMVLCRPHHPVLLYPEDVYPRHNTHRSEGLARVSVRSRP